MSRLRNRVLPILLVTAALAAAIAAAVVLRKLAPPEPARLLPSADAFLYFNLKPLRRAGVFQKMPPVKLDPEYAQFVQATGIRFERDLDEVALAVHLPAQAASRLGPAPATRYSEIFAARFDSSRLAAYLKQISSGVESYRNVDVYLIPLPGRTVRASLLGPGLIAVSNAEDPGVMRGILDRARELALPFRGPDLLRQYYRDIPFLSFAWGLARIKPPAAGQANRLFVIPGGFDLFVPSGTVVMGSLRYTKALQLQLRAVSGTDEEAVRLADQLNAFLTVVRALEVSTQAAGTPQQLQSMLDSVTIQRNGNRIDLSASVAPELLQELTLEPPPPPLPPPPAPPGDKHGPHQHPRRK